MRPRVALILGYLVIETLWSKTEGIVVVSHPGSSGQDAFWGATFVQ